jgi:seryl-tRNA synthetase
LHGAKVWWRHGLHRFWQIKTDFFSEIKINFSVEIRLIRLIRVSNHIFTKNLIHKMLLIGFIRQNAEFVKERLAAKYFGDVNLVDTIISLDEEVRKLKIESETIQSSLNAASKEIGMLMGKGQKDAAEIKKQEVAKYKSSQQNLINKLNDVEKQLHDELVKLPNLPHTSVPKGKTPEENDVVKEEGAKPTLYTVAKPHWDLIKQYDLVDFETGVKLTGRGFPVYKGKGAKLQRALKQYFLDYNTAAGYTEYAPPLMVNEASAYGTGQLPDKEGQMYHVNADGLYLIPTSEVPITNIYRDEIVKAEDLPIKMTGFSACFRREAGSFGADVRGLNRVHQFDKVEIVQLVHPEKSYEAQQQMVEHIEGLLIALELPYRILRLCAGDMSFASALTYDFEVYSAAQQKWLEVSSVSNFETFQTNRMKIRFKGNDGKTQLVHSLNGSSLAFPRIVACLLENNQTENGIELPKVLHSYFGATQIN